MIKATPMRSGQGHTVAFVAQLTLGDVVAKVSSIDLGRKGCADAPDEIDFLNRRISGFSRVAVDRPRPGGHAARAKRKSGRNR